MFLKLCQHLKDLLNVWYFHQIKTQKMCNETVQKVIWALSYVLDQYKTKEVRNEAVQRIPRGLKLRSAKYKTQEMYNKVVKKSPWMLELIPDQYKTQEMCNEAVEKNAWMLEHVPDQFVTQKMCNEAVKKSPCALWWYKGYEQCKAQKAKIKEELMAVAWHPGRWCNWCVPEHEKKELEIYFA